MFEDCKKSQYSQGWDIKLKEPETVEMLEIGINALLEGMSKNTIAKLLVQEAEFNYVNAQAFAGKMWKEMMKLGTDKKDGMPEKNAARLERIYQRAMENGDFKNALSALDMLNKLVGAYKEKIQITTDEYVIDLLGDGEKKAN